MSALISAVSTLGSSLQVSCALNRGSLTTTDQVGESVSTTEMPVAEQPATTQPATIPPAAAHAAAPRPVTCLVR